jgi:cation diffusion facilitator CzcD-associated flavoprotein CzcO
MNLNLTLFSQVFMIAIVGAGLGFAGLVVWHILRKRPQ